MTNDYVKATNAKLDLLEADNIDELQNKMNECNKQGLYPIHESAFKGYINAVKRFIEHSKDKYEQLELQTKDELQSTPILLAALGSNLDIVKLLYELGAQINVCNAHGHTIVEIGALRQDIKLIKYLISIDYGDLGVYRRILTTYITDSEEISGSIGRTLEKLTTIPKNMDDENSLNEWKTIFEQLLDNELVEILIKVFRLKYTESILSAFFILMNLYEYVVLTKKYDIIKNFCKLGALGIFHKYIQIDEINQLLYDTSIVCLVGKVFEKFTRTHNLYDVSFGTLNVDTINNIVKSINTLMKRNPDSNLLFSFIIFFKHLIDNDTNTKQLNNQSQIITNLLSLYKDCNIQTDFYLFRSLLSLTLVMCKHSNEAKTQFIKENISVFFLNALRHDSTELKELAICCIEICANSNVYVQKILLKDSVLPTLLTLLQKTQIMQLKMLVINCLWSIAGDDIVQRKYMATKIRINYLIDFLSIKSDDLYYISCDALRVLFTVPANMHQSIHDQFLNLHGVNALTRALTNEKENIVLSVIRCIERFSVRPGMVPFKYGQNEIKKFDGITFLVALYLHAPQDLIKIQSAIALACICLDNPQNLTVTLDTLNFNYHNLYKLARSKNHTHQLLARNALALFAFNNPTQQRIMTNIDTFSWSTFEPFLKINSNEIDRCECAFQVVVLAPLITDTQHATALAFGIQTLIDLLFNDFSTLTVKVGAAEKLALLGKMKHDGICEAIVAADGIKVLCDNFYSDNENLQGVCAVALSNYTYNNEGRRKILYRCRHDPSIIDGLKFYNEYKNSKHRLSPQFYEDWTHYTKVGLPAAKAQSKSSMDMMPKRDSKFEIAALSKDNRIESFDMNEEENETIKIDGLLS